MKKLLTLMFIYISTFNVLVFSQEGNLDTSFNVGSGANGEINSIAVQPDGKILIGGVFVNYNGTSINRLARLNSNGSLDNTFNIGTGPSGIVNKIKVLPSGKIFISGIISSYNGVSCNFIVKLNSDGSKDNSFNVYHVAHQSSPANDFYILPDGKILLAGLINNFNGTGLRTLIKLNADGSLDTSFNQGGSGFEANISSVSPYISTIDPRSCANNVIKLRKNHKLFF